jgi:transposase
MLTAATILAETNGFELFKNYKQLVSYAGFDVVERESGTITGKQNIKKKETDILDEHYLCQPQ